MFAILTCFGGGILLGSLMGHKQTLARRITLLSEGLVFLLLFVLGAAIGGNAEIMGNLWSLGLEGLLLALGAILGSLLLARPVERFLPEEEL